MDIYENLFNNYVVKKIDQTTLKMTRNLQPEIEKIKSINASLMDLGYINESEKNRLRAELQKLLTNLDHY